MAIKTGPSVSPKNRFKEPRLIIPSEIYKKINFWVDESDFECSWLGTIDHDVQNNDFHVVDVFLLDQENGGASTDMDQNSVARLLYDERDNPFDIKWWGHSHVKMDVFWSGTDIATMETLSDGGWFVSTVFNQHRKMRTAFTMLNPLPIMIDNINTMIHDYTSEKELKDWKEEFNAKVKKRVYAPVVKYTFTPKDKEEEKKKIPAPAHMPDWKSYATEWQEGLHLEEIQTSKPSQQEMMEADSMPSDPFEVDDYGSYRPSRKPGEHDGFTQQDIDYIEELYANYMASKE